MTQQNLKTSRPQLEIDVDFMFVLLELSILPPSIWGGGRVPIVVGTEEPSVQDLLEWRREMSVGDIPEVRARARTRSDLGSPCRGR